MTTTRTWRRPIAAVPLILLLAVALIGVAGWALTRASAVPHGVGIAGNSLIAVDAAGRTLWTHAFNGLELRPPSASWSHIGDLDGDRRDDILTSVEIRRPPANQEGGHLLRFSADGRLVWSLAPNDRVTFRDNQYGPPWPTGDVAVYQSGGETRVAWAIHHFTWWPSLLITVNARGERQAPFVNAGWIQTVRPSHDGRHLLLSGVTNSRGAYFFAVLDADHPSGRSPEPPGSATECLDCPAGDPLYYFVFPRTDVSHAQPFPAAGPSIQLLDDGTVQVQPHESAGPNIAATIYDFSSDFTLAKARHGDAYWEWHRQLESQGRIRHRAQDCPERRGLNVQRWTAVAGWETLPFPPASGR